MKKVQISKRQFDKLFGSNRPVKRKKVGKRSLKGDRFAPLSALPIFLYLSFKADNNNRVEDLTFREMATELNLSPATVVNVINWLDENRFIKKGGLKVPSVNWYEIRSVS